MRVTSGMYYDSLYSKNNSNLQSELFDVNKQIASGLKIQYAKDDVRTFTETMRLDNEIVSLNQIQKSTESGYKMANQTDVVLNEFETTMNRMRVLLVQAANGTNSDTSLDAIAQELRSVEDHFKNLANTSINGQYLFSGSAVDVRPIADDGTYMGNGESMNSFTGSQTSQQYNISGEELFLGEKYLVKREITTNVVNKNLMELYDVATSGNDPKNITPSDTIKDLLGDTDTAPPNAPRHFYVRGTKSDGTTFNSHFTMTKDETVDQLLQKVGEEFGNTNALKLVNVEMNSFGEIVIKDKMKGSSLLDFHMVGAVDFNDAGADDADVTTIGALDGGETDFGVFVRGGPDDLFVKEFVKSNATLSDSIAGANINGIYYDRNEFSKEGSVLTSNVSQISKLNNKFVESSTKLSEASSGTLDGTTFKLEGISAQGNAYDVDIDLATTGSTFSVGGNTYNIFDMDVNGRKAVPADEMSYRQLMDVMNMIITENYPTTSPGTAAEYDTAVEASNSAGEMSITPDGKISFDDLINSTTSTTISLYDSNSGDFSQPASNMTFNTNDSVVVRDPKTDFFDVIDQMILSVENHSLYPDSQSSDIRNVGIENAIAMMDDLQDHVFRAHAQVGAQSTALTTSIERAQILEISSMTLRSSVIDTDLAEASLTLTQLSLNYEAMLSTVGKISKLSLVNYI